MSKWLFLFYGYGDDRELHVLTHSFPTRHSTELRGRNAGLDLGGLACDSCNRPAVGQRGRDGGDFRPLDADVRQDLVRHGRQLAHGLAAAALPAQPGAEALPDGRGRFAHVVFAAEGGSRLDIGAVDADVRSEEHTSELQSLMRISYAVF